MYISEKKYDENLIKSLSYKFELFDFETYFIDRKYYINRSLNLTYNKPSSLNNGFQKKKCFICNKIDC